MPRNDFKVGEMRNKRTPNSKTWMNFDGSYTTEIHSGFVHFDDGENNLHNINTSLFDEADADSYEGPFSKHGKNMFNYEKEKVKSKKRQDIMNRDDFDYQVPTLPFSAQIPKNIIKGYSIGQNDEFFRFIPQGASPSRGYVNREKDNEIRYQDAWNDTDIILEVTTSGIKESMILKTDRAPFEFSFKVEGNVEDDLTMGSMILEPAWLVDNLGEKRDVVQTIRREGDQTFIDLVANVDGLVYPIEIDPTVTFRPDEPVAIDTTIFSGNPNANFGSSGTLSLGLPNTGTAIEINRILMKWDLSSIPVGSAVSNALLTLYNTGQSGWASMLKANIKKITAYWDEHGATWNMQPPFDATIYDTKNITVGDTKIPVTNMIQHYVNGSSPNYGFVIDPIGSADGVDAVLYSSSSTINAGGVKPLLEVTYTAAPSQPTITAPNGGETWNSSHTISWLSAIDPIETIGSLGLTGNTFAVQGNFGPTAQYKIGQTFVAPTTTSVKEVKLSVNSMPSVQQLRVSVYSVDANGYPLTELGFTVVTSTTPTITAQLNVAVSKDVKYAIVVTRTDTVQDNLSFNAGVGVIQNGIAIYFYQGTWNSAMSDVDIAMTVGFSSNLQYQIQLATDGANWSDIVSLTTGGVTQYVYDFINVPQTSLAKIRIRAYDGGLYGPWDESNGVFSIIHNTAPTSPTNLSPSGTVLDRVSVNRLSWKHQDTNLDPQAKFDLLWRVQGASSWNTVTQSVVNQYWDAPANTFPKGIIEWQVRTYDQAGLSSSYSGLSTFNAGDKPANPTITSPTNGSIISVANPIVQWSSVDQTGYHIKVSSSNNVLLWETIKNSNNKAETILLDLENETSYIFELAIKNADGLYSDFISSNITISYTPPSKAILIVSNESIRGTIILSIDNPTPVGTEPLVSYNSVFRREQGESEFIRIATNIDPDSVFTDYTPASEQIYEYFIRTWGDNETYSDSDIVTESVVIKHAQLALVRDYSQWVGVVLSEDEGGPERSFNHEIEGMSTQFAGRKHSVTEFGEHESLTLDLSFVYPDKEDMVMLRKLAYSRDILLYRDNKGRKEFVTLNGLDENDIVHGWYDVSINPSKTSFSEVV